MTTTTYSDRRLERNTVAAHSGETGVTMATGWGFALPQAAYRDQLPVGTDVDVEQRGSTIVGVQLNGTWLYRLSDEDLAAEHERFLADFDRRNREQLEANREDWTRRERQLPPWIAARLATFRERGGERFEVEGWGYELVIAELAAAYRDAITQGADLEQKDWWRISLSAVETIAENEGTSGNQHDMARALALANARGDDVAGTVAGLTPLTGDPFYEGSM